MTFDGVRYGAVRLIAPYEYHPRVPVTGTALATALRGAYMYSRERARLICAQTYPRLGVDSARLAKQQDGNTQFARIGNTWSRAWTAYRSVPDHHTTLVIDAALQVAVYKECTLSARATYKTTNGTAIEVDLTGAMPGSPNATDEAYRDAYIAWLRGGRAIGQSHGPRSASGFFRAQPDIMNLSDIVHVSCEVTLPGSHDTAIDLGMDLMSNKTGDDRPAARIASLVAWTEVRDV